MTPKALDILRYSEVLQTPLHKSDVSNWHGHLPFAMFVIAATRAECFVELGTHKGDSYFAFCQAVEAARTSTRCFAVDTWRGDPQAGYYDDRIYEDLRAYHDPLYGTFSTLLRTTFDDAWTSFDDGSIDILHIDGCHTYEAVRHDFERWLCKMSTSGIVLLHDIVVHEGGFGVWRFWEEIRERYPSFSFTHSNGLGMVAVGADIPPGILPLFAENEAAARFRAFFSYLGGLVLAESRRASNVAASGVPPRDVVCRIYVGRNGNYSERDSLVFRLPSDDSGDMDVEYAVQEEFQGLRIDPVDAPAFFSDLVVTISTKSGERRDILRDVLQATGVVEMDGGFLSPGDDPQFQADRLTLAVGDTVHVRFGYRLLDEDEVVEHVVAVAQGYAERERNISEDHRYALEQAQAAESAAREELESALDEVHALRAQTLELTRESDEKDRDIAALHAAVEDLEAARDVGRREVFQATEAAERTREALTAAKVQLAQVRSELLLVKSTLGWRLLDMLRVMRSLMRHPRLAWRKLSASLRQLGLAATVQRAKEKLLRPPTVEQGVSYHEWILQKERMFMSSLQAIRAEIAVWEDRPLVSIVMPTYNSRQTWLKEAVDSLLDQPYEEWELIITDDHSSDRDTLNMLCSLDALDPRITVLMNEQNAGISGNTNIGVRRATGELLTILDHDDLLAPSSLYEVVRVYRESRFDIAYSDEDKLSEDGVFEDAFFKPDYSPDYILSCNYFNHLTVYRRALLERTGLFRPEYDGAQDYDLLLRAIEVSGTIVHIPKVLYHWRKVPGSTAADFGAKSYAHEAGRNAVAAAMERRGERARVLDTGYAGHYRVKRAVTRQPLVSIIIPMRDKVEVLRVCLESIHTSTYQNLEIIVVDNGSVEPESRAYLDSLVDCRVLRYDIPFNFSRLNNLAAKEASGEVLLFLNNDIEVITPDWIEEMLQHALRKEVGAVGAKLLYPDGRIQHAGVLLGVGGVADHAHKYLNRLSAGYFGMLADIRNFSAVTGACMMLRKELFSELGGFDEENLAVAFNDVDLCLRLCTAGYLCVVTPVELFHHESISRGPALDYNEVFFMQKRWGDLLTNDPYYNPHLSLTRGTYVFDPLREVEQDLRFSVLRDEVVAAFEEVGVNTATEQDAAAVEALAQIYAMRPDLHAAFELPNGSINVHGLLHWAIAASENGDSCRPVLDPHSARLEEILSTVSKAVP